MLYGLVILGWVIGFAAATVLAIAIAAHQNYKKYVEQQRHNPLHDKLIEQTDDEIEEWKRKVFRP